ncbi:hypothetical protein [Oceanicoccus sp. KOV_DT_Chl]|uniref:hypothetical protein n=1 Tax=Oceanicoccus sp. KOV_DT_Chl TaxID=1904639 RepID=UPI000C798301|nr:hypothetical protein [Oceanicoccus sp. KOV_DT_Chl]
MSYTIDFDDTALIVTVTYTGTSELDERLNAVSDVCAAYSQLNPLRLLINVIHLDMQLSVAEQKSFGLHLASNEDLKNTKVAVLHATGNNPNIIVDSTAYIKGYQLAQFDNKREAEEWLLQF